MELLGEVGFDTSAMTKVRTGVRVLFFAVFAAQVFGLVFCPLTTLIGKR